MSLGIGSASFGMAPFPCCMNGIAFALVYVTIVMINERGGWS
jgi:hypothetical protein